MTASTSWWRGRAKRRPSRRSRAAVWGGDPRDDSARIAGELAVRRAGLVEDLKRVERQRRLACGAAQVGLERVAESAVGVAVAAQGLQDRVSRPVGNSML
ncbi:MAG: hypothetical protein M3065_04340 [Actinomycetota bacterium]|nr:hypothetical protein [Actinomycetota bacterium]